VPCASENWLKKCSIQGDHLPSHGTEGEMEYREGKHVEILEKLSSQRKWYKAAKAVSHFSLFTVFTINHQLKLKCAAVLLSLLAST